ncbi:hypothetical protein J2754_003269 [Halarchaeum solikamskense]|uniref:beta strand repeat-containing protein n=1 Tax=Halarchaeum nitratireducens TaxID=489913 RepID=UPI001FD91037|nr:dockerin type I domain-containing protein [Halarchaeum solikamskense]MBP2252907.1 hypothetical protein [Halarchaeum solikamskense]
MTNGDNAMVNVSVSDNTRVAENSISVNATNQNTDTTYTLVSDGAVEMGEEVSASNFTDGDNNKTEYVNLSVPLPAGSYTIGASASDVNDNTNSTTGLSDGFHVNLDVSLDPASVVAGQETTVNATLSNVPDSWSVNYALLAGGDDLKKTGSTSSDSFSVTSLFDSGDANYTVTVSPDISATELNVSNNDGYANVSVTQGNYISELTTTPENPVYNDTVTVSGTLMNSSTGDAASSVTLNFQNGGGSNISVSTTDSQGNFEFSDVPVADAGNYSVVNSSNTSLETVFVGPADADVSLSVEETNLKGFDNDYTVTADGDTGAPLTDWSNSSNPTGNYLNVTGPFNGTINSDNIENGTLLNAATSNGNTSYFHVNATAGNVTFNATPTTNTSDVTVTLENNESDTASGYEVASPDTFATLDLTGSDELATQESDQDLFVTGVPSEINVNGTNSGPSSTVSATVVGSNNKAPASGRALANATVSLSGPGIDVADQTINGSENSDGTVDFTVFPSEAGTATLTVEAYSTDQEDYITQTVNVTVTGDNYENLTPTSAEVGDNSTVSVQILKDGTPQNNRVVRFRSDKNVFNVSETDSTFSLLRINAQQGQAHFGSGSGAPTRSINTNNGIYAVEGVSFENTGNVDLKVRNPDKDLTVNATDALSVTGVDVYDITSDAPNGQLLASQEQTVQFNVTRDGERVNGSDLQTLAGSLSAEQDGESIPVADVSTINTTGNSDVDTIEANLTVPSADADVNVSVTNSGQRGEATYGVVAPAVSTNMTADNFTEATQNGPVNVTVSDPRTGDVIPGATLQITPHNITANTSISQNSIDSDKSTDTSVDANGSKVITVTPDIVGEDPASIEFATNASGGSSSYVTAMNVSVGEITTGAPESVAPDTQTSTTFVVRDANGDGLEQRSVTLNGAGVDKTKDTDSDGVVDFTFTPDTGTVNINVTNDLSGNQVTVDTINARQQVALSLSAHDLPAYAGDSVSFELNRGDVSGVSVKGTLTVYNASDDVVKTTSITGTKSVQFNESGDYTVVASKDPTDSKSFINASANVTIEGYANASITADPATNNTTSTHSVTLPVTADSAGDSLNGIEIDYSAGDSMTDVSEVGIDNIQSVTVSGDSVMVQEASVSNNGHTLQLSFTGDTQLQQGDVVEIVYDDVQNPASAGDYEVTGALNYQSDPVNTQSMTLTITNASAAPVLVGDTPAQDLDGDGTYEDVNGDGELNAVDVQALFSNLDAASGNAAFDINGDGEVNAVDVQALFASL